MKKLLSVVTLLLVCSLSLTTIAQTPDDQPPAPVVQPLIEIKTVQGKAIEIKNQPINGQVFERAVFVFDKTVFQNTDNYDLLQAWIGKEGGGGQSIVTFHVLGDGKELYRSPKMRRDDPAINIRVPIHGYTGITLYAEGERESATWSEAAWADAVVIKLPTTVPVVVSPGLNEIIEQTTPLAWRPVTGATGYLLELQSTILADPNDENDANRFVAIRLPAETNVYNFDTNKMPKGRWRWRVHALSRQGFLGEMIGWRMFTVR